MNHKTKRRAAKPQPNRAKRLECAVSRRCAFAWSKEVRYARNESAGMREQNNIRYRHLGVCTPNASRHQEAHAVKAVVRLSSLYEFIIVSFLPCGFELQKDAVNSAQRLHDHEGFFVGRNVVHDPFELIYVLHRLAIDFGDQIVAIERAEFGPTAR